jgi:hypothetical protein
MRAAITRGNLTTAAEHARALPNLVNRNCPHKPRDATAVALAADHLAWPNERS